MAEIIIWLSEHSKRSHHQIVSWLITFEIAHDTYVRAIQLPGSKVITFAMSAIFEKQDCWQEGSEFWLALLDNYS